MTAPPIASHRTAARRRVAAILAGLTLPPLAALVVLAWRGANTSAAIAVLAVGLTGFAALLAWRLRGIDARWIARRLDAAEPALEDSTGLLLADEAALAPLARLQRARILARADALHADIRPRWPRRALAASAIVTALLLGVASRIAPHATQPRTEGDAAEPDTPRTAIVAGRVAIEPPAYLHAAPTETRSLDVQAPQGATLRWRLRFEPQPTAAALAFHDGTRIALERDGGDWTARHALAESALYRIVLDGAPPPADDALHRLYAQPDRAPDVHVTQPAQTLTVLDAAQPRWTLAFEAEDDHGIAHAELSVTLAQGSGENIAVRESTETLAPIDADATDAVPRRARYARELDPAALGFAQGDDLIVRVRVTDNREPQPNVTRSAAFILRWPAAQPDDLAPLDGVVQRTLPAYFRSQRQIILDTEALLAETPRPEDDRFLARSDAIGVDQRVLRLRYGRFLGEETEIIEPPGGSDAHDADHDEAHDADHAPEDAHDAAHGTEPHGHPHEAAAHAHAHDHGTDAPARFGDAGDVVAEYGHVHDIAEAATLLDPATKETLRAALDAMWQAERALRTGDPEAALPHEYRALEHVKRVQQSTRIYLARVGLEIRPPDEARRLSGEREGLTDRADPLAPQTRDDTPLVALWRELGDGDAPDWAAAERWLAAHRERMPDALGLLAALDRARRDPGCSACRDELRARLWAVLPQPAAGVPSRAASDARGAAYLDALAAPEDAR